MIFDEKMKKGAILAPMAGFTDLAFRTLCAEFGALSCVTEMVSAKAIDFENKKTETLYVTKDLGIPQGIQLFGDNPQIMSKVVRDVINDLDFDYIDINMACPMPKIVKNGEGCALMDNPLLAHEIVSKMVKFSNKPISVKIRLGMKLSKINAGEFAKVLEEAGASHISLHGRSRDMYYSGEALIDEIAKVKEKISIPLIANGDIFSPEDAKRVLEDSSCDAIMVGRGALGKPWLFKQIKEYFETGEYSDDLDSNSRVEIIRRQYFMMKEYKPEKVALLEMRKHSARYLKGLPSSSQAKEAINRAKDEKEFLEILDSFMI